MSIEEISERLEQLKSQYALYKNRPFDITIARGIPSTDQLKLSEALLNETRIENWYSEDELDIRNYGGLFGLKEARELFGTLLNTQVEETFVGGNSSLQLMYATLVHFMYTAKESWSKEEKVKFICPSPGYDRHWFMLDHLGIEMIPVELTGQGPDMETVEKLVAQDPAIKGMFVVPTYNNPTGETISDKSVARLANMFTAYEDFIILWDLSLIHI